MNNNQTNERDDLETKQSKTTISNATAKALIVVGALLACAAAIAGFIVAQFSVVFMWIIWVSGIILVAFFFGISEIINLLEIIKNKL